MKVVAMNGRFNWALGWPYSKV